MTAHVPNVSIRRVTALTDADVDGLAAVAVDCVAGGASVGFMAPFDVSRARDFWRGLESDIASRARVVFIAEDALGILGTVSLVHAGPENQPHRADIAKMLVHRRARRQGVGAALMAAAEAEARVAHKTVLVLDTASIEAARLYARLGWQRVGVIPNFALLPQGGYCDTTFFCRRLG